ncbi:Uncharacterized protein NV38_0001326 [Leptospira kirschneri serovar Mozdok]|nr:Uncharacterized protein NV38_0001326 [Leptospira kirschneri serovar Mozdok]NDK06899.1 hypothetical protein [Leptospira kirschneri serovar Mozdok]
MMRSRIHFLKTLIQITQQIAFYERNPGLYFLGSQGRILKISAPLLLAGRIKLTHSSLNSSSVNLESEISLLSKRLKPTLLK